MAHDPEHHRRSIRLDGYDYAESGAYFVTICTQDHLCLFGEIVGGDMRANGAGNVVQRVWDELSSHYPGVETDAFVVMPNHVHGIIVLAPVGAGPCACPDWDRSREGQPRGVAPTSGLRAMSLGDVVARFKTLTTTRYADGVRHSGWLPFPGRLWQRNYYEHIIRNERALNHIRRYIMENPHRWAQDRENPAAVSPEAPDAWRIDQDSP
jgi:putative transposase